MFEKIAHGTEGNTSAARPGDERSILWRRVLIWVDALGMLYSAVAYLRGFAGYIVIPPWRCG